MRATVYRMMSGRSPRFVLLLGGIALVAFVLANGARAATDGTCTVTDNVASCSGTSAAAHMQPILGHDPDGSWPSYSGNATTNLETCPAPYSSAYCVQIVGGAWSTDFAVPDVEPGYPSAGWYVSLQEVTATGDPDNSYLTGQFGGFDFGEPAATVVSLSADDRDRLDLIWVGIWMLAGLTLGTWFATKVWGEFRQWFHA
jgi:hypothetical protein